MRCDRIWWFAYLAGQAMAVSILVATVSGCGMQMPGIRSPFYLKSDNPDPVGATANRAAASRRPAIKQRSLNDDNIYVPAKVEFYCRGPNFDPNAECRPPGAKPQRIALGATSGRSIVVQRGETLFSLARRHGVSVDDLAEANALETHELLAGQLLYLPDYALR